MPIWTTATAARTTAAGASESGDATTRRPELRSGQCWPLTALAGALIGPIGTIFAAILRAPFSTA